MSKKKKKKSNKYFDTKEYFQIDCIHVCLYKTFDFCFLFFKDNRWCWYFATRFLQRGKSLINVIKNWIKTMERNKIEICTDSNEILENLS